MPTDMTRRRVLAGSATAVVLLAVGACAGPGAEAPAIPEIRFTDTPPIRLRAGSLSIVDETPAAPPTPAWNNVFATMPDAAMRNWARDRLVVEPAEGGIARYRITEASIEHSLGEKPTGVFSPDRLEKFMIRVAAGLEVLRDDGTVAGSVLGNAWGEESFPVDMEPYARKKALDALVRRVMTDFDGRMEQAIRTNMAHLTR